MSFRHAFEEESEKAGMFEVAGNIRRQTEKAIYLDIGTKSVWLPRRQIKIEEGRNCVLVFLPEWLAVKAGLA